MMRLALLAMALLHISAASHAAETTAARIVIQDAPLAGSLYYDASAVWDRIKVGDRLTLVREPANPHDIHAVRLEWHGRMLGYVPRRDNSDLARQMDHGARVEARITELHRAPNGRHRISYEISIPLK